MEADSLLETAGSPAMDVLTPRTKVARMLAEIDAEMDEASTLSPSKESGQCASIDERVLSPSSKAQVASVAPQAPSLVQYHLTEDFGSPSPTDASEESPRRPQGRAARRMLGENPAPSSSPFPSPPSFLGADDVDDMFAATPTKRSSPGPVASFSPTTQRSGSALFVSPGKSDDNDSEDELPANPIKGKLAELVAQKRAERLAREAEEKERRRETETSSDLPQEAFEGPQDVVDPDIERIMSDATRPTRKASKKAQLEMERESQRMLREQALAHKIQVKKKFTTKDLFAKFNFRPITTSVDASKGAAGDGDTTASSAPNSDGFEERTKDAHSTPPSSPPTPVVLDGTSTEEKHALNAAVHADQVAPANTADDDDDAELPDLAELIRSAREKQEETAPTAQEAESHSTGLKLAQLGKAKVSRRDSSDDELDIIPALPSHLQIFEKAIGDKGAKRSADSNAIQRLKHLSNFHVSEGRLRKKGSRPSINPQALDSQLRKQAKEQARQQQLERIEELKAKGIEIQTTEDREKEAEAMENLLEKARQDAVKLRQMEKAATRNDNNEGAMQASDDEDEDEDYASGSEEESEGGDVNDEAGPESDGLIEDAAEESSDAEDDDVESADEVSDNGESLEVAIDTVEAPLQAEHHARSDVQPRNRKLRVITDEDDEDDGFANALDNALNHGRPVNARLLPADTSDRQNGLDAPETLGLRGQAVTPSPATANDPFAAFNFESARNANLLYSPTQAFHATMQTPTQATQEDSLDVLKYIAPPSISSQMPSLPDFDTKGEEETTEDLVKESQNSESQVPESQRVDLHWELHAPETPIMASLQRKASALNETPGWEPSQDHGLPSPWTAKAKVDQHLLSSAEHETQSTVRLRVSESPVPSQSMPRRGRLVRNKVIPADDSDEEEEKEEEEMKPDRVVSQNVQEKDAFREMARKRKAALTAGERADADREMRGMMDDQAEESDDEYAGVGGDDYVAPETDQDREMIDSSHLEVDERAIAAHFAERQRIRDEAETSRLYKDLTTGVLRRKMGANAFDLEEDEDEVAARRRHMKQQEQARKRKALLKDINVASLAEGRNSKGKDAFLKAIADDDGEVDIADLSDPDDASDQATQSEPSQAPPAAPGPLLETSGNKRLRVTGEDADEGGPMPKQRRTAASSLRRPTSLLEVKQSVSFLLEESGGSSLSGFMATGLELNVQAEDFGDADFDESSEDEYVMAEAARQNDGGFAPNPRSVEARIIAQPPTSVFNRRTTCKSDVVDRLSLKRSSSNMESAHGRTAWAAGPTTGGFKVPSLLRRATTNTTSMTNDRGVTTPSLSRENSGGIKMGGTKKSSLAYQARAEERKAVTEASARRREENTARIAQLRRNSSALNRGLTGRFE